PTIARLVAFVAARNDQKTAEKILRRIAPAYYSQRVSPNHFLSHAANLDGEFRLGTTFENRPFGLSSRELNHHITVFGEPGYGKTNLLEVVVRQCQKNGVYVVYFDRKGDMLPAVRHGVDSIHWQQMALAPLCPQDTG